jgi:hypothetical protein
MESFIPPCIGDRLRGGSEVRFMAGIAGMRLRGGDVCGVVSVEVFIFSPSQGFLPPPMPPPNPTLLASLPPPADCAECTLG